MKTCFHIGVRLLALGTVLFTASALRGQACVSGPVTERTSFGGGTHAVSVASLKVSAKAWDHLYRAVEAARTGKDDQFSREVEKALQIAPTFAEAYVLRASWEVALRRHQAAVDDALTARRLQPDVFWSGVILAGAYNGLRRYADAAVILQQVHALEQETWQAKYEMARAVIGRGDAAEALRWSKAAFQSAPANCLDARLLVADAYLLAHRWTEAAGELAAYLESKLPQQHHTEVLAALEHTRRRIDQEDRTRLASAEIAQP